MDVVRDIISELHVNEDVAEKVVEILTSCGVAGISDMQFITDADLVETGLSLVQKRKLLHSARHRVSG